MSLTEYILSKCSGAMCEGFISPDQCAVLDKQIDWTRTKTVLEIGFNAGHSADFFLSHPGVTMVSFELGDYDYTPIGKEYIDTAYPGRHEMVYGDSTITIPKFETRTFDLIFIDGGHDVEIARADLAHCMRFAHDNTVVIMDDVVYEYTWMAKYSIGPTRAWKEFVRMSMLEETFHADLGDGRGMSLGRYLITHDLSVQKPNVYDAFMFYNELDMLKYRLKVLDPYVDRFVICECPVSFAGKPKPLYFAENKHMFEPWLHKITHLVWNGYRTPVHDLDDSWYNENTQRNHLLEGLRECHTSDIVIISDLDEIPDPKVLEKADEVLGPRLVVALEMDLYYYDIEHRLDDRWDFARIARYGFVRDTTPHKVRNSKRTDPVVKRAGWHMSYFGSDKFIMNKTKNYAHIEADTLFGEVSDVRRVVEKGIAVSTSSSQALTYVPKSKNTRLPPFPDELPHQVI
jgi:beta-1,4-mannosyl-glycoprotein beta-1,4-N-acetylglucosaminyltransferase